MGTLNLHSVRQALNMEVDPPKSEQQDIKENDLFKAAENGDSSTFESLSPEKLSKALSLRNEDGRSLLHVAASSGHSQVFLQLHSPTPFSLFTKKIHLLLLLYRIECSDFLISSLWLAENLNRYFI